MVSLLAALALAAPHWEPIPVREGAVGAVRIVDVPSEAPLRLHCSEEPTRHAIWDGHLVDGPFPPPVRDGDAWLFPPTPGFFEWAITPADCAVARLDTGLSTAEIARIERRSDHLAAAMTGVFPEAEAWLAEDFDTRYLALRPSGPHWPHRTRPAPDGGRRVDDWWEADRPSWTIRGPRRLRVHARPLQDAWQACLVVDGVRSCLPTPPAVETVLDGDRLVRTPLRHGQTASWSVLLDRGVHEVAVEQPALVRLEATTPDAYTRLEPSGTVIWPPGDLTPPQETVPPDAPDGATVLFGPSRGAVAPDEARWVPLDAVPTGATLLSEGVLALHLEGEAPCTVRAGADAWEALPGRRVHRFLWTGDDPAPDLPRIDGCAARVRVTGIDVAPAGSWVASSWWPAGRTWTAPEGATLQLAVRGRVTVRVNGVPWTVHPAAEALFTPDGVAWQGPVRLPLPPGPVTVTADAPILTRVRSTVPWGRLPACPPGSCADVAAPPADRPEPGDALYPLNRAIAAHPGADAFLARADWLAAHGEDHLAWIDAERAARLAPDLDNPVADRLKRRRATLLFGPGRWVPADPVWVPAGSGLADEAARGDFLAVARALRERTDPRPWWREALRSGQIPTAAERIAALRDLVVHTPPDQVDHPWLWPLRGPSRWETVHLVRGARRSEVTWPADEEPLFDLFPEPWPVQEIVRLSGRLELQLPPSTPRRVPVRCRSTRVEAPRGCAFLALDARGEVLAEARTDVHGTAALLELPPGPVNLAVLPREGVEAQIRLAGAAADLDRRSAWAVDGVARFDVLGPTVVRLETWSGDDNVLEVTVDGVRSRHEVAAIGPVYVPVDVEGPAEVTVRPRRATRLRVSHRIPVPDSRPVPDDEDRVALALSAPPVVAPVTAEPPPPLPWAAPEARSRVGPPVTVLAGLGFGTEDLDDEQPEERLPDLVKRVEEVVVLSRPGSAPWWLEGGVHAEQADHGQVVEGKVTVEGRLVDRGWRLWLLADASLARGHIEDPPLTTAETSVRLSADTLLAPRLRLIGSVSGLGRGVVRGEYTPAPDWVDRLWSWYKDHHRVAVEPEVELRGLLGPWVELAAYGGVTSNDTIQWPIDRATLGGRIDLSQPHVALRLGAEVERRFADLHRAGGYFSPELSARGTVTTFPSPNLGLQVRLSAAHHFSFRQTTALVGLRVLVGRDRGLSDLRPSRIRDRHAAQWGHAEESW